jgi:hypothetical protein
LKTRNVEFKTGIPQQCGSLNRRRQSCRHKRREKHTSREEGENNLLTSNEANARVIYAIRRQVFYCRTIENES